MGKKKTTKARNSYVNAMRRRHGSTTTKMVRRNKKRRKDARNDPVARALREEG